MRESIFPAAISMPGEGRLSRSLGRHIVRISGEQTAGVMGVWEEPCAPGEGPPMHMHRREDEMFFVLEGRFRFWCGDETFEGGPGTTAVLPRDVPHRFRNVGAEPGPLLIAVTPGGFERFFSEVDASNSADPAAIGAIAERYGLAFVEPEVSSAA
jgi:mannose-6-phosphate isomerase-like protein (cupin superfamily)